MPVLILMLGVSYLCLPAIGKDINSYNSVSASFNLNYKDEDGNALIIVMFKDRVYKISEEIVGTSISGFPSVSVDDNDKAVYLGIVIGSSGSNAENFLSFDYLLTRIGRDDKITTYLIPAMDSPTSGRLKKTSPETIAGIKDPDKIPFSLTTDNIELQGIASFSVTDHLTTCGSLRPSITQRKGWGDKNGLVINKLVLKKKNKIVDLPFSTFCGLMDSYENPENPLGLRIVQTPKSTLIEDIIYPNDEPIRCFWNVFDDGNVEFVPLPISSLTRNFYTR